MKLNDLLKKAGKEGWAVPHFNISNFVQLKGIIQACRELKSPVMIGTSEGEVGFIGFKVARKMIDGIKEETGLPIYLNADHFHSFEMCKQAIDEGYDSVLIDMSKSENEENVSTTKQVVEYARNARNNVEVEAELGYIVTDSSKIYKEDIKIPDESLTDPHEALKYVEETGINRFACAVGTLHGIAANEPMIDFKRIAKIRELISDDVGLVLHGGSGISDENFKYAISSGINNIHISTNLRVAYTDSLRKVLIDSPDETTPYKLYKSVVDRVCVEARNKIKLFGSENKI